MGACRERKDIFWLLFGFWPNGKWRGWDLFKLRWWRYRKYIWNDTFGRHWNRLVWCKIAGHRGVFDAGGCGEPTRMYCPCCMCDVKATAKRDKP